MVCAYCKADVLSVAEYCKNCGSRRQPVKRAIRSDLPFDSDSRDAKPRGNFNGANMAYCGECGTAVTTRYCTKCGAQQPERAEPAPRPSASDLTETPTAPAVSVGRPRATTLKLPYGPEEIEKANALGSVSPPRELILLRYSTFCFVTIIIILAGSTLWFDQTDPTPPILSFLLSLILWLILIAVMLPFVQAMIRKRSWKARRWFAFLFLLPSPALLKVDWHDPTDILLCVLNVVWIAVGYALLHRPSVQEWVGDYTTSPFSLARHKPNPEHAEKLR